MTRQNSINRVFQSINDSQFAEWASGLSESGEAAIEGQTMCNYEHPSAMDMDKGHGRIVVRLCHTFEPDTIIKMYHKDWPKQNSVVRVKATRRIGGKGTTEVRYYISSLPVGSPFNTYIRNQQEVENKLHWSP